MRLGIFDSGLGGFTVVRRLREHLPQADMLYFADQANLPYGDRTVQELHAIMVANVQLLASCEVDAVVMGCNTSCAVAATEGWPELGVPIFDLLEAGANMVFAGCHLEAAVIATNATVRSAAYTAAIRRRQGTLGVQEAGAPMLVPAIESGAPAARLREIVASAVGMLEPRYTCIVLGCSHFPLVESFFAEAAPGIAIIDPAVAQAEAVVAFARRSGRDRSGGGTLRAWTNGDPVYFERAVAALGLGSANMSFGPPRADLART